MLSLTVINFIAGANVAIFVQVEDWKNLPVVGHQSLSDHLAGLDEFLQDLEHDCNDLSVSGVEGG